MRGPQPESSPNPPDAHAQSAPPCPHAGRPVVRRRRYRVRSMGWTVVELFCPDCGASLRSESLKA